ncbi:hypothetical protein TKK_0017421 [Trichogramma kaykai]|uniref:Tetratricopeptide repeat protein 37 n=1 Tax=Trichogramma kaykai TaxID=54128 RepID=A0ABD2W417_9HYME
MSKDGKVALKEAKELLKKQEYSLAIKMCKKVIKEDKKNYNAHVLMGAALKEVEALRSQAPMSLKKAIDLQPDNPLAWQGLLVFYEGEKDNAETWTELIPVYNQILQFESDTAKFINHLKNLITTLLKLKNDDLLAQSVKVLIKLRQQYASDEEKYKKIIEAIAVILTQYPKLTHDYDAILEETLIYLIEDESSLNRHEYYKKYLKHLYKMEKFDELFVEATKMHNIFNQDIYPLEWICRVYSEHSITHDKHPDIDIVVFYETLLDHDNDSILGYFAKAVNLYETENLIDSRNILNQLVAIKPKWFHVWLLLGKINIKLYCWEEAEYAATNALSLVPEGDPHKLIPAINIILLESLIKSGNELKVKKAEEIFEELSDNSLKSSVLRAHLYVNLGNPKANMMINDLKNKSETAAAAAVLCALNLLENKQFEEAADVLGSVLESSNAWLTLGKIYWEMADFGHSLMALLKGISADPYNWECLVYLGRYHQEYSKDYDRSRKCYQKALQINPNSAQAGIGLSSLHRLLKNTDENIQFLQQLTSSGKGPKWALIQLGLQFLDKNEPNEAVSAFRNAVKTDPSDSNCWECLADAYLARGAHLSALRSYERVLHLNPESFYSKVQLANIELLIGDLKSAKTKFREIISLNKTNPSALKGLAESCFKLGKEHASAQLLARARDDYQDAIDSLIQAVELKKPYMCIWKLLGDICYNVVELPEKYCYLNGIPSMLQYDPENAKNVIHRKEIFLLSIKCYCIALNISKDSSLLWHDLSQCYLAKYHSKSNEDKKEDIKKCLAAAKEAVNADPLSWNHWNLLGVVCMVEDVKNYALAQHCFAMALDLQSNNPIPWTNLGSLYLILGDAYRANEAFSWAQRMDPAYINCWIGQALIAENIGRTEAIDLFRHSTQLGYHPESAKGYAHLVLKTIMDPDAKKDVLYNYAIEKIHAVTVASDSLNWYLVHETDDPCALNTYGLLLERQKLYKPAAKQFSLALNYLVDKKLKDKVNINLARVLVSTDQYIESVEACAAVKDASFASHCQLALSLFKAESFKESYEAYEAALHHLADTETDKAHVLCAMAAMAFMFQESNDAKTLLYQSISIKPPIISGLLALAALGMLDHDKNLTELVLKELKVFDNDPKYRYDIAKITAYSYLIEQDMEGACRILCKYAHRYPDSPELWTSLARTLLKMNDLAFTKFVEKALFLGRNTSCEDISKITCMSALTKLITSNPTTGLRSVLNIVHSFPANVDSWSNLITALLPRWSKISQSNAHWLMVLASRIRHSLVCTRSMEQWLLKNEKEANDIAYCTQ